MHGLYTDRDFQIAEEVAWHGLTKVKKPRRNLFPEIVPVEVSYRFNGKPMTVTVGDRPYMVPVSTDDGLPVAPPFSPDTYTLFTPREAWDWVIETVSGTNYEVKSMGMLWNRSRWFMGIHLAELEALQVGGRECRFALNFSGGLDKKMSPQAELNTFFPVCSNTVNESRRTGTVLFNERLNKNFGDKLEVKKKEMEKLVGMPAIFKVAMDGLADKGCTQQRAQRIFSGALATPARNTKPEEDKWELSTRARNTVGELTDLHVNGLGNAGRTEFDLLNAWTQFYTHGSKDTDATVGKRFASSEFGGNADTKARFARTLVDDRDTVKLWEDRGKVLVK